MNYQQEYNHTEQYNTTVEVLESPLYNLIVWNDDINTFEWVIESLMEVCQHNEEQAEQCAMLIHFQGKYAVKNGDSKTLKVMCEDLLNRSINATVEEMANR